MPDPEPILEKKVEPAPDLAAENAALKARLEALEKKPAPEDDLLTRAKAAAKVTGDDSDKIRKLESAITFNMKSADFLKNNASLLPAEISSIFEQADKEKFDDASEKAASIKSGVVQSFFSVQANVDLLTSGQKASLDEFMKLTKNGKQEKAQHIYEMIFEPAFERLKDTKKAEALNRGHHVSGSVEEGYKQRLISGSSKHYRLEKK